MQHFTYTGLPSRVIFGVDTKNRLAEEVNALGIKRALILTTPQQEAMGAELADLLGDASAGIFTQATIHTPVEVTNRAVAVYADSGADGVVSIGGGSTIGLGKAIALRTDAPQVVLPTSYSGSEMTPIIGQTEGGKKTTQSTLRVLPETVIYDVNNTLSLPPQLTVTSGMNAIAHAVEALYAQQANPVLSLLAEEGVAKMVSALRRVSDTPNSIAARSDALHGAWLCAICLGSGGVALHHKLCHVLGGTFDLPHAETHTVVLPHALRYNAGHIPEAMRALQRATNDKNPAAVFFDIAEASGVPVALKDIGMPKEGIDTAVGLSLENRYFNPRPLEQEALKQLLSDAWHGVRPETVEGL